MNASLADFTCPACGGWLPDFPVHTDRATYCSSYCRVSAEPEVDVDDDEDDAGPVPSHIVGPAAWNVRDGWFAIDKAPF